MERRRLTQPSVQESASLSSCYIPHRNYMCTLGWTFRRVPHSGFTRVSTIHAYTEL